MIYHILGADILHHNRTLLAFFQEMRLAEWAGQSLFYVVSQDDLAAEFPALSIRRFAGKMQLAKAVVEAAKSQPQAKFVLHGQFNFPLWLAILCGRLPGERCAWHVWGADLYEHSTAWRFRLAYPIRRAAQRKMAQIWATRGDLQFANSLLKRKGEQDQLLYFPSKMPAELPQQSEERSQLTILLGNSGDRANRHLQGLDDIHRQFGSQVRVIIPMGYPVQNHAYVEAVAAHSKRLFPAENVQILTQKLAFEAYLAILAQCDVGLFLFKRQQGIGTICALLTMNIPVILAKENPFCVDMQAEQIPFLFSGCVNQAAIQATKQQLAALDKGHIRFFPPNYLPLWRHCLANWADAR